MTCSTVNVCFAWLVWSWLKFISLKKWFFQKIFEILGSYWLRKRINLHINYGPSSWLKEKYFPIQKTNADNILHNVIFTGNKCLTLIFFCSYDCYRSYDNILFGSLFKSDYSKHIFLRNDYSHLVSRFKCVFLQKF